MLGGSIVKNNAITKLIKHKKHVVVKHFSDAKIKDMKHYVKPTQEKTTCKYNYCHVDTKDLRGNKNSVKVANEIVEFATSIKTSENNVVVFSIVPRKDRFNNKAKEVNENLKDKCEEHNLQLIQHDNINPFHHTNSKGLHLNKYRDKQFYKLLSKMVSICKYKRI